MGQKMGNSVSGAQVAVPRIAKAYKKKNHMRYHRLSRKRGEQAKDSSERLNTAVSAQSNTG